MQIETTQTTMDKKFLTKTFMYTICKLQREQPVYTFKAETLI